MIVDQEELKLVDHNPTLWEQWSDFSRVSKAFIGVILLESICVMAFTIAKTVLNNASETEIKYSAVICIGSIFLCFFAITSVFNENKFELVAFLFVSLTVLFYVLYTFVKDHEGFDDKTTTIEILLWVRLILTCIFSVCNIFLGWSAYHAFGWKIYRKIGADVETRKMFLCYQIFMSLLKLDFQFGFTLVLAVGMFYYDTFGLELIVDVVGFVLTIVWAVGGYYGVRREIKWVMITFFALAIVEPTYIVYKMIRLLTLDIEILDTDFGWPFIIMAGLAVICRIALLFWAVMCFRHFGNGLELVFVKEKKNSLLITS